MKQSRLPKARTVSGAQRLHAAASRSSLVRFVRRRGDEHEDERMKKESESEGFLAKRRDDIYRPRRVTIADLPWPRTRWRFPQEMEMAPTISRAVTTSFGHHRRSNCLANRAILKQMHTRAISVSELYSSACQLELSHRPAVATL